MIDDSFNCYSETLKRIGEKEQELIDSFCKKIGYRFPLGYYRSIIDREFNIWTNHPGMFIGEAGRNIDRLKEILKEEYLFDYKIKIHEIQGGFANLNFNENEI